LVQPKEFRFKQKTKNKSHSTHVLNILLLQYPVGNLLLSILFDQALYYCIKASQMCHLAQAVKRNEDDLLKGLVDKNVIEEVKHILEMVLLRNDSI